MKPVPLDSLPPHILSTEPETIRPSRRELAEIKKRRLLYAFIAMQFFSISSAAFIYVMFFDPLLGAFRVYSGLLALLVAMSSLSSLAFNVMMLPWKKRKPSTRL